MKDTHNEGNRLFGQTLPISFVGLDGLLENSLLPPHSFFLPLFAPCSSMIELLSPAKTADIGIQAINAGADAVYIGASSFGARKEAGNPVADIARLSEYAHRYRARTYLALNTILHDSEMDEALTIIRAAWNAGIDGLIIQDMGLLECDLPPVPLIASTQTDNRSVEKVKFLQDCGFSRVILARELSLDEIHTIRESTSVELEFFVHGALCVSYSGQCYISEALAGRSANRGECAQVCRQRFTLSNREGKILSKDQYLLSLRDLNLSEMLPDLLKAGISSFKIEGRLKDEYYVKNITSYYRRKLDAILEQDGQYRRASSGISTPRFEADPEKTFNRGYTSYFANGKAGKMSTLHSSKSLGKPLGQIKEAGNAWFTLDRLVEIHAGDGLCFFNSEHQLTGFYVNKFLNGRIYPHEMKALKPGMQVYRNQDASFEKQLAADISRNIRVAIQVSETDDGFQFVLTDEDGYQLKKVYPCQKVPAINQERALSQMREQLSKTGNTLFVVQDVHLDLLQAWHIPLATLNGWRRDLTMELEQLRSSSYRRTLCRVQPTSTPYPLSKLDFKGNVLNSKAISFYQRHGVTEIGQAFELDQPGDASLMQMRFCLKREQGICPRENPNESEASRGPFFITTGNNRFRLVFDCAKCEMRVHLDTPASNNQSTGK